MTELLCRLFVKNPDGAGGRERLGAFAGIVGIFVNVLLFAVKIIAGFLTSSIAIAADAVNNLSDAGASVVSLISFRVSSKPADRKHPFGHARIEYVAAMTVSFAIILIAYQLFRDSVEILFGKGARGYMGTATLIILAVSVLVKLWLCLFNRKIGDKISSGVVKATATDSLIDALATLAVLVSSIIFRFFKIDLDSYMGILLSLFIAYSGVGIFRTAMDSILGCAPDTELVCKIRGKIWSHPEVLGIHDLLVHSYGPGRSFITLHIELDDSMDFLSAHDAADSLEKELEAELGMKCIIHLDPVSAGDTETKNLYKSLLSKVRLLDERFSIHDFRIQGKGTDSQKLVFDLVAPYELKKPDEELISEIKDKIGETFPLYSLEITLDRQ